MKKISYTTLAKEMAKERKLTPRQKKLQNIWVARVARLMATKKSWIKILMKDEKKNSD